MAEFKVSDSLTGEISAFRSTGASLNDGTAKVEMGPGIATLKTGRRFVKEHSSIIQLMQLYQQLIAKDAEDLMKMKEAADTLDETIASTIR